MDRGHLSGWSADLDEDRFVAALAALGVLAAVDLDARGPAFRSELQQRIDAVDAAGTNASASALLELLRAAASPRFAAEGLLAWRVPDAPANDAPPPAGLRHWPSAAHLADAWQAFVEREPLVRLAASAEAGNEASALAFVGSLSHGAARLAGVHARASWAAEQPTEWHWPFTIATLPGDPLDTRLVEERKAAASSAGARFVTASGRTALAEVLAFGEPLPRALERTLEAVSLPQCALVVVAGFGSEAPAHSAPLLRALVARVRADGIVVVPTTDSGRLAKQLGHLAEQVSFGCPLDVALMRSVAPGHVAWLGAKLLAIGERAPARQHAAAAPPPVPSAPPPPPPSAAPPPAPSAEPPPAPSAAPPPAADGPRAAPWWRRPFERHREVERMQGPRTTRERARAPAPEQARPPELEQARPPAPEPPGRPARHLQQRSLRETDDGPRLIRDGYVRGEPVTLFVRIGERDDASWDSVPTPFPEHELPKDRDVHTLQVVVHESDQFDEPMLREIELPRLGPSSEARFLFTPRSIGTFDARISVLHRGRVLQTARLQTSVRARRGMPGSGIALLDEAQVRHDWSDLGARRRFDLAMVLNHAGVDGTPRLTAVAERRAWATSLDGISEPLLQLNTTLSEAAHSVADHADGLDQGENPQLLVRLARIGADLYSALCLDQFVELAHGGFDPRDDTLTHIQVVSARADAVVPIEFFYDYPPPSPDAAKVCPGHRDALKSGRCPADCAGRVEPDAHVCPMGFWGLRKVIERHVYSPALGKPDGAEVVIQAEPAEGRDRLDLGSCAVLGFSVQVPGDARAPLLALLSPRFGDAALEAATWKAWKETVGQRKPALLVAFPHNEGRRQDLKLEIGGDFLATLRLPREYVRPEGAPPPLVFLLGCDVAGTAESFSNHIRYFRQAGAAAVISTTATVFGAHAVTVGSKILARLLRAGGDDADQLGELILDARREALLESLPMALCIVAFGDADWKL